MLERIGQLPEGIIGIRASGTVTRADYEAAVQPLFDEVYGQGRRVRFLYQIGPNFEGFTPGAALEDARVGLRHLRLFERCAVVSDVGWVREASRMVGPLLPCPLKVFPNAEYDEAVAWLSAPIDTARIPHRLLSDAGVLIIEPERPLTTEDFDALALTVDPWIEAHGELRGIVIHAREFPGWENPGSFVQHVRFVRNHQRNVRRVALCASGRWAELAPRLAENFVSAEIRQFPGDHLDEAITWARATTT
ncbi:MAG: STAS/SEC14 domain-containing protein [Chloroflexota bacterium]